MLVLLGVGSMINTSTIGWFREKRLECSGQSYGEIRRILGWEFGILRRYRALSIPLPQDCVANTLATTHVVAHCNAASELNTRDRRDQ